MSSYVMQAKSVRIQDEWLKKAVKLTPSDQQFMKELVAPLREQERRARHAAAADYSEQRRQLFLSTEYDVNDDYLRCRFQRYLHGMCSLRSMRDDR